MGLAIETMLGTARDFAVPMAPLVLDGKPVTDKEGKPKMKTRLISVASVPDFNGQDCDAKIASAITRCGSDYVFRSFLNAFTIDVQGLARRAMGEAFASALEAKKPVDDAVKLAVAAGANATQAAQPWKQAPRKAKAVIDLRSELVNMAKTLGLRLEQLNKALALKGLAPATQQDLS